VVESVYSAVRTDSLCKAETLSLYKVSIAILDSRSIVYKEFVPEEGGGGGEEKEDDDDDDADDDDDDDEV
jgi:hypothetical protein